MFVLITVLALVGFGAYELFGMFAMLSTAGIYGLAYIVALIMGPRKAHVWLHDLEQPVRTRVDSDGIPILE